MKKMKITALFCIALLTLSSAAFAAKGGAKFSAPKRPAITAPAPAMKAPAAKTGPNQGAYKPSQSAKAQSKDAPMSNAAANAAAAKTANSASPWGGMMRNVGLLAGGMLLGGLLSSMFGMGASGLMADILGLLANVAIFAGVFMVGRFLWNKFRGGKKTEENVYRTQPRPTDIRSSFEDAPRQNLSVRDIKPPSNSGEFSYDAAEMAKKYRNR